MQISATHTGWNRIASGMDVEIMHGVAIKISSHHANWPLDADFVSNQIQQLTGLRVSVEGAIKTMEYEQEFAVCVNKNASTEVLRCLALSSAAMFVDPMFVHHWHKPIVRSAVDWDLAEYNYDFNHAVEHYYSSFQFE